MTRSSLRYNKFITLKTIESGLWMLQALRQLLNIAHNQSGHLSEVELSRGKTTLGFVEDGVKINQKVYQKDILEASVGPKAFRKCKLDVSARLCTRSQGQKDAREVQGEFSRYDII
ncbi:hypothetical protein TNCV_4272741 [Trichonephila clavipes]|nr:hypothetical protein TNCV_4272741 [Trichonephila clavipes]